MLSQNSSKQLKFLKHVCRLTAFPDDLNTGTGHRQTFF